MRKKILFICHGNICRSPMAEYLFKQIIKENNEEDNFIVTSKATSTEEIGNGVYPPVRRLLESKGIDVSNHHASQITLDDYDYYDYIIYMDSYNKRNLNYMFNDSKHKFTSLLTYVGTPNKDIDDPWYTRDFEGCYNQILNAVQGLYNYIKKDDR